MKTALLSVRQIAVLLLMAVSIALAGCQTSSPMATKENIGTVAGGALGAAVGSQIGGGSGRTAAMIGGALLGGYLGRTIGRNMDDSDRRQAGVALSDPNRQPSSWTNPETGYRYTVTPINDYTSATGQPCQDYIMDIDMNGRTEQVRGTACQQSDGSWQVVG